MIKRITKLFILLILAVIFVPAARADGLLNFNIANTWTWTMPQDATPTYFDNVETGFVDGVTFIQVPEHVVGLPGVTFDLHFFRLRDGGTNNGPTTNLIMSCDPFGFPMPGSPSCDYFEWIQIDGNAGIWNLNSDDSVHFMTGNFGGLVITEAPEPSALAMLLAGLLAVARRTKT